MTRTVLLGMLVTALTKEFESAGFEFWVAALNEHFELVFADHSKFLDYFPRSDERQQTYALRPITPISPAPPA